ncbi:zinc finger protein Xfin-like [Penaeus chinensis]|uniref:zinc finger protein Xfin-like n=1 Tax=Penaeus chinensis TaxID=139456 RepID=UPI001FB65D74|nr:zinc finger protein Xfin-like [Penaeus chinensis]XP_047473179.1 zinc finger protein Xfin-like [Penaeus chinensis]XP_047473180.1 zinc finger protein Xfin-like [Penaeus chinensis]XP_047473181.1 zinc finger protein Xfin-like [Penaeus chinensis]XP_047473182.1 zinc finger protein Xfin-like [Penaeus chinensis]XP_047473183.1 zinc finger protein Xfin-like [Penaeus chinensis]
MTDEMLPKLHEEEKKPPNVIPEDEMSSPSQPVLEGSLAKEEHPKENPSSRTEAGEKPFQCSYCEKTFNNKGNMVKHEKRIHTNEKPFHCLQCEKKFITRYELKFHKLKVHPESDFTCPHCSYKFQSKANLERHKRVNTREKHVSCTYCSEKFEADCALKEHVKIHITLKVFSCQQCNAEFTAKSLLSKHVEIHATSDYLKCEEEPASPTFVKDSGEEAWNEDIDEQGFCLPDVQRGIFSTAGDHSENDSSSYSQTHTGGKIYGCMECKKEFTLKANLRKHENTHHGKKAFQCSQCEKKCFSMVMLKTHLKVHTGKNVFVCHYCNVKFAKNSNLKKHILLHTAEKLYKCPHCDAVFEAKCILREHVRNKECDKKLNQNALIHTKKDKSKTLLTTLLRRIRKSMPQEETGKERTDLKCLPQIGEYSPAVDSLKDEECPSPPKVQDICFAKDCQCTDNCSLHASTETHEILFRCSHCKEEFRVENDLVLHEKTHAKDTALQCSQCAHKFGSENDLVQHEKTHKDKEECRFPSEEHTQCKGRMSLTSLLRRHRKSLQRGEVGVTDQVDLPQVTKDPPLCSALDCHMPLEEMNEERTDLKCLPQIGENSPAADSLKDEESCPSPKVQDKCPAKECHCPNNCSLHASAETHEILLRCSHCEEKFRTKNDLIQHEETHTKDRAFQCSQCVHKFGSENALVQHEATHKTIQKDKGFQSSISECRFPSKEHTHCKEKASFTSLLRRHQKSLQREEVEVTDQVDLPQVTENPPKGSMQDKEPSPSLKVQALCPAKDCHCPNNCSLHPKKEIDKRLFRCSHCKKKFTSRNELRLHKKTHTRNKPFHCVQCDCKFSLENDLIQHEKTHTKVKAFQCTHCRYRFSFEEDLIEHEKSHAKVESFQCTQCECRFTLENELIQHVKMHTSDKPFICSQCKIKFTTFSELKQHDKIHTDEKGFVCLYCEKKFFEKLAMSRHMKRNTGRKQFKCTYCDKSFKAKCILRKHVRIHQGEEPFHCTLCNMNFIWRSQLDHHIKNHGNEENTEHIDKLTVLSLIREYKKNGRNRRKFNQRQYHRPRAIRQYHCPRTVRQHEHLPVVRHPMVTRSSSRQKTGLSVVMKSPLKEGKSLREVKECLTEEDWAQEAQDAIEYLSKEGWLQDKYPLINEFPMEGGWDIEAQEDVDFFTQEDWLQQNLPAIGEFSIEEGWAQEAEEGRLQEELSVVRESPTMESWLPLVSESFTEESHPQENLAREPSIQGGQGQENHPTGKSPTQKDHDHESLLPIQKANDQGSVPAGRSPVQKALDKENLPAGKSPIQKYRNQEKDLPDGEFCLQNDQFQENLPAEEFHFQKDQFQENHLPAKESPVQKDHIQEMFPARGPPLQKEQAQENLFTNEVHTRECYQQEKFFGATESPTEKSGMKENLCEAAKGGASQTKEDQDRENCVAREFATKKVCLQENVPDGIEAKDDLRIFISILIENLEWSLKNRYAESKRRSQSGRL